MADPNTTSSVSSHHVGSHDYNNFVFDKNSYLARPLTFSGDVEQFSSWKRKMYSHIIVVDEELWVGYH